MWNFKTEYSTCYVFLLLSPFLHILKLYLCYYSRDSLLYKLYLKDYKNKQMYTTGSGCAAFLMEAHILMHV